MAIIALRGCMDHNERVRPFEKRVTAQCVQDVRVLPFEIAATSIQHVVGQIEGAGHADDLTRVRAAAGSPCEAGGVIRNPGKGIPCHYYNYGLLWNGRSGTSLNAMVYTPLIQKLFRMQKN